MEKSFYPPIHFLTYLNRSGSTLLARKLSEFPAVGMGMETQFDHRVQGKLPTLEDPTHLSKFLDGIYTEQKYPAWGPPRSSLEAALQEEEYPILFRTVLQRIFHLTFPGEEKICYVHKAGRTFRWVKEYRNHFPGARFLFLTRDPRAIFSSMRRSIDSRTGQPMEENVVRFAIQFRFINASLEIMRDQEYLLIVRYEDLLLHEEEVLARIIGFLGIPGERQETGEKYYERIPARQKHLHEGVQQENDVRRIDGWQQELDPVRIRFLEIVLKREIQNLGYKVERGRKLHPLQRAGVLILLLRFCLHPRFLLRSLRARTRQEEPG